MEPDRESVDRALKFTEECVDEWCDRNDDSNPIHLDPDAASESPFGERVVPGMMLLDQLSGMLTALGGDDQTIILSGITAARFRDPVLLGETVTFHVEVTGTDDRFTTVEFSARVEARGSLVANGVLTVVVE